jgi:phage tail tape-measure protein
MNDKLVVSEQALRQLLALLEKQSKKDNKTIMNLWQQLTSEKQKMPRFCC